jgi:hypothetical protein
MMYGDSGEGSQNNGRTKYYDRDSRKEEDCREDNPNGNAPSEAEMIGAINRI